MFVEVFLGSVLASAEAAEEAEAALAAVPGAVEVFPAGSGGGSGFSSIRTMYW